MTELAEFRQRLTQDWLGQFCEPRGFSPEGFDDRAMLNLSTNDATDFIQSVDCALVMHTNGFFTAARSEAKEQIFWEGARQQTPRKITLWLEPIITIGALRRLQRDYHWPAPLLGLQSRTWAFDLVAYSPTTANTEMLVCEVKKSRQEVDSLLRLMKDHWLSPLSMEGTLKGAERNAFKKVQALRNSNSKVFWALGPDRYGYVFEILRGPNNSVEMLISDESKLSFFECQV